MFVLRYILKARNYSSSVTLFYFIIYLYIYLRLETTSQGEILASKLPILAK